MFRIFIVLKNDSSCPVALSSCQSKFDFGMLLCDDKILNIKAYIDRFITLSV